MDLLFVAGDHIVGVSSRPPGAPTCGWCGLPIIGEDPCVEQIVMRPINPRCYDNYGNRIVMRCDGYAVQDEPVHARCCRNPANRSHAPRQNGKSPSVNGMHASP